MKLGAFSVSLAVKDIAASRAFYEKLGFAAVGGQQDQNWLILRNGDTTIGLFQGMFEKNCLTFNPGWNGQCETLEEFDDVRAIQKHLQSAGVDLIETTEADGAGPAHITLVDPDGNPILIDQHVG
jgi:catechol 2,3-dioxygenase-like lactoylglutathione lyase family enzyme